MLKKVGSSPSCNNSRQMTSIKYEAVMEGVDPGANVDPSHSPSKLRGTCHKATARVERSMNRGASPQPSCCKGGVTVLYAVLLYVWGGERSLAPHVWRRTAGTHAEVPTVGCSRAVVSLG